MYDLTPECYSILKHYHDRYKSFYDMFLGYEDDYDHDFPFNDLLYNP